VTQVSVKQAFQGLFPCRFTFFRNVYCARKWEKWNFCKKINVKVEKESM